MNVVEEIPESDFLVGEEGEVEIEEPVELLETRNENEIRAFEEAKEAQRVKLESIRAKAAAESSSSLTSSEKRIQYLMQQSEVFAHFLSGSATEDSSSSSSSASSRAAKGRARMTEDAEDRQLMKASQAASTVTRLSKQPSTVQGQMRPYQLEGLNWMIKLHDNNINGILADEMGLGKTLQSISLLAYLRETRNIVGPHIVIVPKSTVSNWLREFKRWCPCIRTVRLQGSKEERALAIRDDLVLGKFDVLVSSYESILLESRHILKIKWKYVVIDEAHRIKNENSSLSKMVRLLKSDFRLLITGTPLQNNLHELWALLNFLLPDVFDNAQSFDSWFNVEDTAAKENVIKKLHTVLRPFLLRRVKHDVEKDIPPKRETKLFIGLSAMQRDWYTKIISKDFEALNGVGGDRVRLLNILMQLRKVCNHPYLFEGAEVGPPFHDGPHLFENAGKLTLLNKLLPKLREQGSRVLIFSQMTRMLDILEDYMRLKAYQYCRIDGSTSGDMRDEAMDSFNKPGSEKFCFLLSTRAGGLGINLQTADTVILYDSDWNPQVDLQAMDRAHRIGQTKEVRVFRFVSEGTVEEKIVERADRKLFLDAAVIQQGRISEKHAQLSKGELMTMVRFGADEIINSKGGTLSDEDIDALLTKGEERTAAAQQLISTQMQHNLANFSVQLEESASFNLFTFEGENFKGQGKRPVLPFLELVPTVREGRTKIQEETKPKKKGHAQRRDPYPDYQFFDKAIEAIQQQEDELAVQKRTQLTQAKRLKDKGRNHAKRAAQLLLLQQQQQQSLAPSASLSSLPSEVKDDDVMEEDEDEEDDGDAAMVIAGQDGGEGGPGSSMMEEYNRLMQEVRDGKFDLPAHLAQQKRQMMEEAFTGWTRKDHKAFVDALERNGRTAKEATLREVSRETGKVESDVDRYFGVFMQRYKELSNAVSITERIEKGERRMQRDQEIRALLDRKAAANTPLSYQGGKGRFYSEVRGVVVHLCHFVRSCVCALSPASTAALLS